MTVVPHDCRFILASIDRHNSEDVIGSELKIIGCYLIFMVMYKYNLACINITWSWSVLCCLCIQIMPHNFSVTSHSFLAIPSSLASGLTCTSWQSEKYRPLRCSMPSCRAQYSVVWAPDTGSVAQNLLTMALIIRVCHSLMSRPSSDLTDPEPDQTWKTNR